jgi:hypothetical protein
MQGDVWEDSRCGRLKEKYPNNAHVTEKVCEAVEAVRASLLHGRGFNVPITYPKLLMELQSQALTPLPEEALIAPAILVLANRGVARIDKRTGELWFRQ